MREIGTMWQIGILTEKLCFFVVRNGSFSAFWRYSNEERVLRGFDVGCTFLLVILTPPKPGFLLEFAAYTGPDLPFLGVCFSLVFS